MEGKEICNVFQLLDGEENDGKEIYNFFDLEENDGAEIYDIFDLDENDGTEIYNIFDLEENDGKEIYNTFQLNRPTRTTTNNRRKNLFRETDKKYNAGTSKAASSSTSLNTKWLHEDTEDLAHELAMMQGRMENILTQAELAQREPKFISWERPPKGFTKLNVDGSLYDAHHRAGFGCLLRDDCGAWVVGISGFLGNTSILYSELVALKRGLHLAWDWGVRKLICHSDSLMAVTFVSQGVNCHHEFAGLVADIQVLLRQDWEVRVEHTLREGNSCADWLAKDGAKDDVALKVWVLAPPSMTCLLMSDSMGFPSVRL